MTQERIFECDEDGCRYRTPSETSSQVHQVGHLVRQANARVEHAVQEMEAVKGLAAQVAALPDQIDATVKDLIAAMEPRHSTADDLLLHTGDCPTCQRVLDGYAAHVAQQAPAVAPAPESKPEPPPAAVAPEPRPWRIPEDDVDHLALDAYGLVAEQGDNGEAVLRVRDASLWDEALAARIVPAGCMLHVGADGKTQYVCEVPRG